MYKTLAALLLAGSLLSGCTTSEKSAATAAVSSTSTVINFNDGWLFVKDVDTTGAALRLSANAQQVPWEQVSLPHTDRLEPIE